MGSQHQRKSMSNSSYNDNAFPVVVIGAGLAGLTAAAHLAARDVPPLVLEADLEWPGGRMAGGPPDVFEYDGRTWSFHTEHGVHALWGNYDNMRAVLDRFTGVRLYESEGEEWIDRLGMNVWVAEAGTAVRWTWLPAPFHYWQLLLRPRFWTAISIFDLFSFPGFMMSVLLTLSFDPIMEEIGLDGLMMKEYFRMWTRNLRQTFIGLGRNLLAAPEETITLTSFIAALRFFTMLRRDSWKPAYLPANPHTCVLQPIIDRIERDGGVVMRGARAYRLERQGDRWRVQVDDARRGMRSVIAECVILAMDPPAAERLLTASPDMAEIARGMRFPSALPNASVRLWFDALPRDGAPGGMFTGDSVADNFFWLHRIREEFREWHAVTGGSALEMHLYVTDEVLARSDQVLLTLATAEAFRAFPRLRGHFVYGTVRRNERTQTRFLVPTKDSLHVETPWPNILACGDWIGYPSPAMWMERCCVTGIAAANHVLQANGVDPFEIIPPRKPEWLVRVLETIMRSVRWLLGPVIRGLRVLRRRR